MIVKLRNSISLLMVVILLTPSIVKLEHHHVHFVCNAKTEKHIHTHHEKCLICNFEFSFYFLTKIKLLSKKTELKDGYNKIPYNSYNSDSSEYSFLLRAPPLFANRIC
jgi:hypothetical protein